MRHSTSCIALGCSVLLAACTPRAAVAPEVRIETVPVAITVPCAVTRPEAVRALRDRVTPAEWSKRPPGAKAQAVAAQVGARLNYADALAAATSGCPERRQASN